MLNSGGLNARKKGSGALNTGKLISAHYLEIGYLLERIESAETHYQTLGIERSAETDQIIDAYQTCVATLHPHYHKVRAAVPDEMLSRVDQAFKKVSQAFAELTNSNKRERYDHALNPKKNARGKRKHGGSKSAPLPAGNGAQHSKSTAPSPARSQSGERAKTTNKLAEPQSGAVEPEIMTAPEFRPAFTKAATQNASHERRRCDRFKLALPIMIAGYNVEGGKWQEITKTIDVSRMGVAVRMRRNVKHGLVVHVTLPLPPKLRSHGFSEAGYNMYAIVRRIEPLVDGFRVVGLEFIGAQPPGDYLQRPWATFRTQKWTGPNRRHEHRFELPEPVAVEYLDESMARISREAAVTENISASGARICVKAAPSQFEFVRITNPNHRFNSIALLRNRYLGSDGHERICVQFVDQKWPV